MTREPRRSAIVLGVTVAMIGWLPAVAAATPPTGYLSAPTDQVAVPGMLAGAEITPEGDLYTGWAEYELKFGRLLRLWDQPTRTLPDPGEPLLTSALSDGPVRYTLTVFAVAVEGTPVAYETLTATDLSARPLVARAAMLIAYTRGPEIRGSRRNLTGAFRYERPASGQPPGFYEQPGQAFSPAFSYSLHGRDVERSGLLLARGPAAPSRTLPTPNADTPTAPHAGRLFETKLRPGSSASWTWQIPLNPPPANTAADRALDKTPRDRARAELTRLWSRELAGSMQLSVPEAKVIDTYRAALTEMLMSRYNTTAGWVQGSNKLQYQAFWIRDAALETDALDLAGLHTQAEQNLQFIDTFQQPDGLFISRPGQYDGLGEALWALSEHAQLTRSASYAAAQLPRLQAAVNWLANAAATQSSGILPPSSPGDDELAYGQITGDDLWAAAGLRSAISDARLAAQPQLADEWQAVDTRFESYLDEQLAAAVKRTGHIPPVLDSAEGQDWGNYYAAYPVPILPATSTAVNDTLRWARAHMVQGLPTYANGRSLHDYLGFAVYQTELAAGDAPSAVRGLYSELTHTTSTDAGWELGIRPWGVRATAVDMAPHGTFAADYVALLRNLLLRETGPDSITLLAGASPAWLAPGQRITVAAAPTADGVISFSESSTPSGETLRWHSTLSNGTTLRWALPPWARHARTASGPVTGGAIALPVPSGSLTVVFDGHRPAISYSAAVASLNSEYRAHGQPAPLHSAAE